MGYGIGVLKIAVMDAAQNDVGVLLQDTAACLLGHAGLGAQQVQPAAHLVQHVQHIAGEVKAGHPLLQRGAQDLGGIDHPDAVWEDQIGLIQDLLKLQVLVCGEDELRVWGDGVVKVGGAEQFGPGLPGLLPGEVVKLDV